MLQLSRPEHRAQPKEEGRVTVPARRQSARAGSPGLLVTPTKQGGSPCPPEVQTKPISPSTVTGAS
ncbi:MAG: hypothetical protein ACLFN4_03900, partial [Candidatus Acetothermia bacterium]